MRTIGIAVAGLLGFLGAAGSTSSNDEARIAAYGAIIVAVVTATGTVVGQIISARNNRKPAGPSGDDLRDIALLVLLDSHTDDPAAKEEAEMLAQIVRERMREQHRERHEAAVAEGDGAVAASRPPRRRRRPRGRGPEDGVGDGKVDS